ncbi:MAG: mevalonate kinase [Microgenomates group bacterium]
MNRLNHIPGKVILAGEHAVVYGKMALATSISLGVSVGVVENDWSPKNPLIDKAIEVAGGDENIQVKIVSELPIGSGLGSSAAVSVATIRAVREYLGKPIDNGELFNLTMECEKLAHGNASGIDPTTVVYGGLIAFTKGQPFERLEIKNPIKLLLVNSGKPAESTKEMVELVANNPENRQVIDKIARLVEEVREKLVDGSEVSELLNQNGLLLEELGVVGERAKGLSRELREIGARVKITGAGGVKTGSGMMVVIAPEYTKIRKLLDNKQIDYFETVIGEK